MRYTLQQELLISNLSKEKIRDLQQTIHTQKSMLSDQQKENTCRELKQ
ncbi:hypothetical protein IGI96_001072 [Enterococcus sp. DIV0421]